MTRKPKKVVPAERPADLTLWIKDGMTTVSQAERGAWADTEVSVGRTNSERALGFVVRQGRKRTEFVLSKAQVYELSCYLDFQLGRLRGRAERPNQMFTDRKPRAARRR